MISTEILQPMIALVVLTLVMQIWMYVTRIPAVASSGMTLDPDTPNGVQMSTLPARVRWKADNYNHLFEQPTIFYATCACLALANAGIGLNLQLAWAYVILRVIHSLHQALWNKIEIRFLIFGISSIILMILAVRAVMVIF